MQQPVMPPVQTMRSQNPQQKQWYHATNNAQLAEVPQSKPPGISPGVQALMRPQAIGAPGAMPVRSGQQYQGMAKPMPIQQPQPMPFQNTMQAQNPQPGGEIMDPNMQRRLAAFGGFRR